METLGQKMKYLREEAGLTQEELAEKLFLDKSTIAKYETDKIDPKFSRIKQYGKFFGVKLDYFDD